MKRGVLYAHSREKRVFDLQTARLLAAPAHISAKALELTLNDGRELDFIQQRVGAFGGDIHVHKLRTLHDDTQTPLNPLADLMRRTGIDELQQYRNVREGTMSIVGHRPILRDEYERMFDAVPGHLVDDWMRFVSPTRPGMLSSFALESHLGFDQDVNQRQERLERDIYDVSHGSLAYDTKLIADAVYKAMSNKLKHGRISHD